MFFWLYTLATTADNYLAPSLEYLTVKFKINESLAGATLLALANGAADVFTAIAANTSGPEGGEGARDGDDNLLSICLLVGATCFISSVIQLQIARTAKPKRVKVTRMFFLRDIIFFMIMIVYLLVLLLII